MYKLQTCKALEMKKPSKLQVQKYLLTPQTNIHFIMKDLKRADTEKALAARVVIAKYCWMSRKVDNHDLQDLSLSLPFPERKGGFDHVCFYSSVRAKTQIEFWANLNTLIAFPESQSGFDLRKLEMAREGETTGEIWKTQVQHLAANAQHRHPC